MVYENRGGFVNRVRVRKDRHPHNARPGTAPISLVCSCRNLNINGFGFFVVVFFFFFVFCCSVCVISGLEGLKKKGL